MTNNIVSALSTFGPLIGDVSAGDYALITPGGRSIGDLYPHVVVEETHSDELTITQHPVEFGTPVTDHAFMQPYTVEIRCGWSNSTAQTAGYVQAVYKQFLSLQASRVPFSISTGKRSYKSMLLRALMVRTDPESEYALMCIAVAQQIVITNTQMTSADSAQASGVTDGKAIVGTGGPGKPGEMGPTTTFDNGIGTIPPGSMMNGQDYSWPTGVDAGGTPNLALTGAGAPTVESLIAKGGV